VIITGGAILLAQSDPQPQSATESLESEMPQPQPQQTPPENPPVEEPAMTAEEGQPEEATGALPEFKAGDYTYQLPPKSLDNHYPPVAKRANVYPAYMDTLGRRFYDLVVDLGGMHLNRDDAEVSYFRFKDYYEFVADLVPEWKDRFLLKEVEDLGKELGFIKDSTDTTQTEKAEKKENEAKPIGTMEKVSERALALINRIEYSCRACHITEIPRVYARYYWHTRDHKMNMATFMVKDPISRKKMRYRVFKRELQRDYYTILRSIDKGSRKQLRESVRRFVKRFNYNQSLCVKCHDTDPYLFTTPTIGELVSDLDKEAHKRVPNKGVLRKTLASLYVQNCKGCHRVHVPTTYVQRWWYGEFDKPPEVPAAEAEEAQPVLEETPQAPQEQPATEQQSEQPAEGGGEIEQK